MILSNSQFQFLFSNNSMKRHGLRRTIEHWPEGVVQYQLDEAFSDERREAIQWAMDYISELSCITFVPKEEETTDYVNIINSERGCSSEVGFKSSGEQSLRISDACRKGNIVHEILVSKHGLQFP